MKCEFVAFINFLKQILKPFLRKLSCHFKDTVHCISEVLTNDLQFTVSLGDTCYVLTCCFQADFSLCSSSLNCSSNNSSNVCF